MWPIACFLATLCALWSGRHLAIAFPPTLPLRLQATTAGLLAIFCLWRSLRAKPHSQSHGSAGFAEEEEVADLFLPEKTPLSPGAILLGNLASKTIVLPRSLALQHGLIVGGSGTGKSFSFFLPNVAFARQASCVVTDPKSELWHYSSGFHASVRYAPTEPEASAALNWIPLCQDARLSELCARAIVEAGAVERQEAPWPDLEAAFLAALFSHTSTLAVPTPLTAYQLLTRTDPEKLMETFLNSPSPVACEQAIIFQQTHERMRGSITPVIAAKLQFMRDEKVARFTSATCAAPDLGRLRLQPEALFWCVREPDLVRLRPLSSLFFTLLLEQLAAAPGTEGHPIPVNLFLDEFANMGLIPFFDTTISLARGRGLSIWLGIQSLSQLTARYGKANAQTILTNCATKIALSGLDVETADYISRSLGQKTEVTPRRSYQRQRLALIALTTSDTIQEHPRLLLSPDEVRRIQTHEALVITGNRRPMLLEKYIYSLLPCTAPTSSLGGARALPSEVGVPRKTEPEAPPPFPNELLPPRKKAKSPGQKEPSGARNLPYQSVKPALRLRCIRKGS